MIIMEVLSFVSRYCHLMWINIFVGFVNKPITLYQIQEVLHVCTPLCDLFIGFESCTSQTTGQKLITFTMKQYNRYNINLEMFC